MAQRKTERLLNLVICLLNTSRPVTAAQIRSAVPGYPEGDEAFARMFERDKAELRELGIPVALEALSEWDDEFGYRIRPGEYALPDISLEPDEAAALALAARLWQQASLAEAASGALLKLRAAGIDTGDATLTGVEPRVTAPEPAFEPLWHAVRERRAVGFDYVTAGQLTPTTRRVEPWGVVSWHGRWYVGGHDRDRGEPRVFRLDRIRGAVEPLGGPGEVVVPDAVDVREMVVGTEAVEPQRVARVRLRAGTGHGLRRRATAVAARPDEAADGWDVVDVPFHRVSQLAEDIAGLAADAVVVAPDDLREAVVGRFESVLAAAR